MPSRDDETPTDPRAARAFSEIEGRVRRASEQAISTATVQAGLILVALGLPHDDPRLALVAEKIRGIVDDATRQLRAQGEPECERCRRREEIRRRSEER